MFGRLKAFYRKHAAAFASTFVGLVLASWLLGPALFNVLTLGQSFAISFTIVVASLSAIQDYLADLAKPKNGLTIAATQSANTRQLMEHVDRYGCVTVRMIEYDAESTKSLIEFFLERGASVHCLLQHPDLAVNARQRRRIEHQITSVPETYFGHDGRIRFSYYRDIASIRARKVDSDFLSVGWYTYDRRDPMRDRQVWGHTNPIISSTTDTAIGRRLGSFFDTVFDNLLGNSVEWRDLLDDLESEEPR